MKSGEIKNLFDKFDSIVCEYDGVECWSARELCGLLGYVKWQTFENVLAKAQEACKNACVESSDHFTGISKMVTLGSGSECEINDFMLTRYACYQVLKIMPKFGLMENALPQSWECPNNHYSAHIPARWF